jgi:hypothetical protein
VVGIVERIVVVVVGQMQQQMSQFPALLAHEHVEPMPLQAEDESAHRPEQVPVAIPVIRRKESTVNSASPKYESAAVTIPTSGWFSGNARAVVEKIEQNTTIPTNKDVFMFSLY